MTIDFDKQGKTVRQLAYETVVGQPDVRGGRRVAQVDQFGCHRLPLL